MSLSVDYRKGREVLHCKDDINSIGEALDAIRQNWRTHIRNKTSIKYLTDYYLGKQDILERVKQVNSYITTNSVVNVAKQAVDFYLGYVFGEGAQYVRRPASDIEQQDSEVADLNYLLGATNKPTSDVALQTNLLICGQAYRLCSRDSYTSDDFPLDMTSLDPANTEVIYSNSVVKRPVMAFNYVDRIDSEGNPYQIFYCYTKNKAYSFYTHVSEFSEINTPTVKNTTESILNTNGILPIIEYNLNPNIQGIFEPCIDVLNTINLIETNRIEGLEQLIQPYWKFRGVELDEETYARFIKNKAIYLPGNDGIEEGNRTLPDVEPMIVNLSQTDIQRLLDDMYSKALEIMGIPDRMNNGSSSTGSANKTSNGWYDTDNRIKTIERFYIESEKQFLRLLLIYLDRFKVQYNFKQTKVSDIDIKFSRNKTDNLLVKSQALLNFISVGVSPRVALKTCGAFDDPEGVYEESKKTINRVQNPIETKTDDTSTPENE